MRALLRKIRQLLRDKRFRRIWYRTVSTTAAIVVFITTYALILPAITMESQAACGIPAHQHDDSCYEEVLVCGQEESEGHHHDDSCYTVTSELVCSITEHQHSEENGCYDADGNLICELPEHTHSDDCYQEKRELTCGLEESEGHTHDASCYEKQLVCGMEAHIHNTECYKEDSSAVAASTGAAANIDIDNGLNNAAATGNGNVEVNGDSLEAGAAATTGVLPEEIEQESLSDGYVPTLEELNVNTILTKHTGFYYYHPEEGQESPASSADIQDWQKLTKDTKLASTDLVKAYFAYTIPAGALNETNQISRYRLPANLHLTDDQIIAINESENGIAAAYVDPASNTVLAEDDANYHKYLGAEAVEGSRTPDQTLADGAQEYISAVVKAENVYENTLDADGHYITPDGSVADGPGEYLGQDLIFIFTPYTIEKNQITYDAQGNPTAAGQKVTGWFACDFNTDQIDWVESDRSVDEEETLVDAEGNPVQTDMAEDGSFENTVNTENNDSTESTDKTDREGQVAETDVLSDAELTAESEPETADIAEAEETTSEASAPVSFAKKITTTTTVKKSAEIVFVEEVKADKANNIPHVEEISRTLLMIETSVEESITENPVDTQQEDQNEETPAEDTEEEIEETKSKQEENTDTENQPEDDESKKAVDAADNGKTADSADAEKEETTAALNMPAATFDDSIRVSGGTLATDVSTLEPVADRTTIEVHVEAEEGTFPEGTTMVLSEVKGTDKDTVAEAVQNAVEGRTRGFHAVDICFRDADGKEIEPLKPIKVSMKSDEIRKAVEDNSTAPVVMHVESQGEANKESVKEDKDAAEKKSGTESADPAQMDEESSDTEQEGAEAETSENSEDAANAGNTAQTGTETEEGGVTDIPGSDAEKENTGAAESTDNKSAGAALSDRAEKVDAEFGDDKDQPADTLSFESDSFSVYAVVYTVDFHYEVDGKKYDFSITGGETIGLRELLPILGVVRDDDETDTDEVRAFVEDIASVRFSDEDLVKLARIEEDTTVGQLKEALDILPEYSAELTEEQIAHMDEKEIDAPDWALISLKAFETQEYLTVTMNDGEVFMILVTDAQDALGLSGRTYSIVSRSGGNSYAVMLNGTSIGTASTTVRQENNQTVTNLSDSNLLGKTLYSNQQDTAWTFEYDSDKKGYYITNKNQYLTFVNGTPAYTATKPDSPLYISRNETMDNETEKQDSEGNITYNYTFTGWDGTYLISDKPVYTVDPETNKHTETANVHYLQIGNGYVNMNANDRNSASKIRLCLPENPAGSRKASIVNASDLSDGQTVIVYKKVWNYTTNEYDFFAVDVTGKLVKVWDSSDSIYWMEKNGTYPSIEWNLEVGKNTDGSQSGYLYLKQKVGDNTVYLSPHHDDQVVHTVPDSEKNTVGISLPGRDLGQMGSRIAAWDYDANTTYGLKINKDANGDVHEGDQVGVKVLLESDEFLFAVRDPLIQKQLTTVDTVDSISKGIHIKMFDFSANRERASVWWNSETNRYELDGKEKGRLGYMDGVFGHGRWKSGVYWPNLVEQTLEEDGFPKTSNGNSLKDIFYPPSNASDGYKSVVTSEDANHLFLQSVYDSTGYFYYSGFDNFARLNGDDFIVYEQLGTPRNEGKNSDGTPTKPEDFFYYRGNFLPYNTLDLNNPTLNYYDGGDQQIPLDDDNPRKNEDLYAVVGAPNANYFFGMIMETKFQQGSNGLSNEGDPMVFEFTGDDDMWVYVDGVLLMDIGGVHDAFHGKINFQTGLIIIDAQSTYQEPGAGVPDGFSVTADGKQYYSTIKQLFKNANILPNKQPWTDEGAEEFFTNGPNGTGTFKDLTTHDLKMFYMERGKGASNLQIQFNLPVITGDQFQVSKKMPETVNGNEIQAQYADAAFYYQAYITENNVESPVTWADFGDPEMEDAEHKLARYKDGTPVVWKQNEDGSYTDIFEIKPGQTAIFPVNSSQVEYRVVEVEPEPGRSNMLDYFEITNSNQNPNKPEETNLSTVQTHSLVTYENRPIDDMVNELQIVKQLHGNLYPANTDSGFVEAEETGSPYFEYRVFLEAASGKMVPYSLGEYYQIDGATGQYVYYDPNKPGNDKRCLAVAEENNGVTEYVYTYYETGGTTREERVSKPRITEHTSQNGSIGDIRPGDTIIIKGLMEGTDFIVDERIDRSHMTDSKEGDWNNKYYYSHTDVEDAYIRKEPPETSINIPDNFAVAGTLFDKPDLSGVNVSSRAARGTILNGTDKDAKVTVHNEVNSNLPLQKKWPADSDDFNINDLDENAQVTMLLKRYTLKKKTAEFTIYATVDGGPKDYDQIYTIKDQSGNVVRTVRYSQMNTAPAGADGLKMMTLTLPVGTYTVERSADPAGYSIDHDGTADTVSVSVQADTSASDDEPLVIQPDKAVFTSTYTQQTGSIRLTKRLTNTDGYTGGYSKFAASYTLTDAAGKPVKYADGTDVTAKTLSWTNGDFTNNTATLTFDNLPSGDYLLKEIVSNGSYDPRSYTVVNDPESGQERINVTNAEEQVTFTSTYTQVQTNKVTVNVYKANKGDYQQGHPPKTSLLKTDQFFVGQRIKVSWTRQKDNPLVYGFGDEWIVRDPVLENEGSSVVFQSTMDFTVPSGGIDVYLLPDHFGDPTSDNVSFVTVSTTGGNINANAASQSTQFPQGTGFFSSLRRAVSLGVNQLLGAANGDGTNGDGSGLINVTPVVNDAEKPDLQKENGTYYSEDGDWSMEVTLKRGSGSNSFQILDEEGSVIGSFTQDGSNWNANLSGVNLVDDDGDLYYYYIYSVSEENVPEGMNPTIDTEDNGRKKLYSKEDQDNDTNRILSVTNELIKAFGDIEFSKEDNNNRGLPGAVFTLYKNYVGGRLSGVAGTAESAGEDGQVLFEHIPAGTYYMKETAAPEGFKVSPVIYQVKITIQPGHEQEQDPPTDTVITVLGSDSSISVIKNQEQTYGEVSFDKKSAEFAPLDDAIFGLYRDESCSEPVVINSRNVTAQSQNGGKVTFTAPERTITVNGVQKTIVGIETGDYYMKEITAPDGYIASDRTYFVHVGDGGSVDTSFIAIAENNPDVGDQTLEQYYRTKPVYSVINEPNELPVQKVWNGSDFIPSSITVILQKKVGTGEWQDTDQSLTLTASNQWKGSFKGLQTVDNSLGEPLAIQYKVKELSVDGWEATYTNNDGAAMDNGQPIVITNTPTNPEVGSIRVQKKWKVNGQPVEAPSDDDEVQVRLVRYRAEPVADKVILHFYHDSDNNGAPTSWFNDLSVNKGEVTLSFTNSFSNYNNAKFYIWTDASGATESWKYNKINPSVTAEKGGDVSLENVTLNTGDYSELWIILNIGWTQEGGDWSTRITGVSDISDSNVISGEAGAYSRDPSYTYTGTGAVNGLITLNSSNSWQYEFTNLPAEETTPSGTKYLYRYAVEEVLPENHSWFTTVTTGDLEAIALEGGGSASVAEDQGLVVFTNSKTNETTDLTASKIWKNGEGQTVDPGADTYPYEVTFAVQQKELTTDPGAGNVIVTDPPIQGDTGWTTIGSYTVSNSGVTATSNSYAHTAANNNWGVTMKDLVTEETTVRNSTKYYQYRVVETRVRKNGTEQDLTMYNVQYSKTGTTVTMENTFANEYGVELPNSGGPGPRLIYLLGGLLTAFAVLLLGRRKLGE